MEAAVLVPQQLANLTLAAATAEAAPARKAAGVTSIPKAGATARRKTLCDITNLRCPPPAEEKYGSMRAADPGAGAGAAADGVAQLVKENSDLVRLLEERDKIIELSGTELQKLRLANWHLAQANSQMLAELNHGRNRLKALQHELACSRATTKAKSLELEEAKKAMKRSRNLPEKAAVETVQQQHGCDRAAQIKDGGVVNPEPAAADASSHAASAKKLANGSRKRVLRSRSLGPATSVKMAAAPKEKESVQRRKSMRMPAPQPREENREDLFEIDIGSKAGSVAAASDRDETLAEQAAALAQFPRRSSLGRPIRRATARVASYKEMPVNIKLRRS